MFYQVPLPYAPDGAIACYGAIADLPWAIWLDSAGLGRYDILCAQPVATFVTRGRETEITGSGGQSFSEDDPFGLLRGQFAIPMAASPEAIPFAGGALGYWGYGLASRAMSLPVDEAGRDRLPDMAVGIYDWAVVFDHVRRCAQLVSHRRHAETARFLPELLERLQHPPELRMDDFRIEGGIVFDSAPESYAAAFERIRHYLEEGDCYQVNLAQRFHARASGNAFRAYLALRQISPAPYSAWLDLPQMQILCASPERFLSVRDGRVQTRPIKGTRRRDADVRQDARLAEELRGHPKDRAENLMIVDLLRNDLGKNCEPGSVRAPRLFEVESYASVHHLVSTVEGRLASGRDALHLLSGCFPGGSITGAPKRRAMQIIAELEPAPRGVYCGTIGYVGFDGNMDSNIAIRTMVYAGGEICGWAGGGIVADSDAAAEYQETLDKAAGMLELMRRYSAGRS